MLECIQEKAKMLGYYAPKRMSVENETTFRVAGQPASETDKQMVNRLMEKVLERRRYEQGIFEASEN